VNQIKFTIDAGQLFSYCQHRLRELAGSPCLYSQHIMTSTLHHDQQRICNQLPYFVEIFWIRIYSATSSKNFV